jgi:phosphoribosylpyrophosphate synthetase
MVKLNGTIIGDKKFPNGEVLFTGLNQLLKPLEENLLEVRYDRSENLFETFVMAVNYLNAAIKNPSKQLELEIHYLPYLRADRQVGEDPMMSDAIVTLLIQLCGDWKSIHIFDPHNWFMWRTKTPHHNIKVGSPKPLIDHVLKYEELRYKSDEFYVIYPDAGAFNRYITQLFGVYSYGCNLPKPIDTRVGEKKRDISTGKSLNIGLKDASVKTLNVDPNPNKLGIIIDDLISYGGTATAVATQLKDEFGFERIIGWFSHMEESFYEGPNANNPAIDRIYTSDSILESSMNDDSVAIIPIDPIMCFAKEW